MSVFLCIVLLAAVFPFSVPARTAAEVNEDIAAKKEQLNQLAASIEANKDDKAAAEAAREEYRKEYETLLALITEQEASIANTEGNLDKKSAELSSTIESINVNHELYKQRLISIYKANDSSMLSSILSVDSFTELMQISDALQRISQKDTQFLKELATQRETFERQKLELEQEVTNLNNQLAELQGNRDWAAAQVDAMSGAIAEADAAIAQAEAETDITEEDIAKLQGELNAIMAASAAAGSKRGDGTPRPPGKLLWPVPSTWNISSYYGDARSNTGSHYGIDIPNAEGTPIVAAESGTVLTAAWHYSYGNYIILDHGDGLRTLYAHNSQLLVVVGQQVQRGETISLMGNTGNSFGSHLHFEVHESSGRQDPLGYV